METTQIHERTCTRCSKNTPLQERTCSICGKVFLENDPPSESTARRSTLTRKTSRYVALTIYTTASINFALGVMEGFVDNNSSAMVLNFFISLIILWRAPASLKYPVNTLLFCVALNLCAQIISQLFHLFQVQNWVGIKLLLFLIPAIGMASLFRRGSSDRKSLNR
jgi:hypothetical protein